MADNDAPQETKFMDIQSPPTAVAAEPTPVDPVPAQAEDTPDTPTVDDVPVTDTTLPASPLATQLGDKTPHHRGKPVGAIVAAVVVAVALAGLTVYALNGSKTPQTPVASETQQPAATPVQATDVDKASQDLDAALGQADDSTDLSASDLSDSTLGL